MESEAGGPVTRGATGARPRSGLSRQAVLSAGLTLLDREGAKALSMRKLGVELGVEAMSLYHYVRDREDLLEGLTQLMIEGELPVPRLDDPWDDALRGFIVGLRRTALRHPAAFELVGFRPLRSAAALAPISALLLCLQHGDLTPQEAVDAYRVGAAYARGFALTELVGFTLGEPSSASVTMPHALTAFAPALRGDSSAVFLSGVSMILEGVRNALSTRTPRRAPAGRAGQDLE
jgi:AcrR family transcriptional regulator